MPQTIPPNNQGLPRVLVVIPTMGERLQTLESALASVTEQRGVVTRLVVVVPDEASDARALAARFGAHLVSDPGRGLSAAVNRGIAEHGQDMNLFAWLGDDDLLLPDGLKLLGRLLAAAPQASVAYGGCEYIDDVGRKLWVSRAGRLASMILTWGPDLVPQPASLIRLDSMSQAGVYDETLTLAMDLDMFLRLRRVGRFVSTRETVAAFRWHADSLTVANRDRSLAESKRVKRSHLPRGIRYFSPVWEAPVALATRMAARRLNRRSKQRSRRSFRIRRPRGIRS